MAIDIPEDEARALIALDKILPQDIAWSPEPEGSAFMVFSAPLVDAIGATIPGLTVELEIRVPALTDDCKYTFTLFTFRPGAKKRAYQLEVVPRTMRSHTDAQGSIYGPHQHVGRVVEGLDHPNLSCKQHEAWFRIFLTNANIKFGQRYVGPFDGRLFA